MKLSPLIDRFLPWTGSSISPAVALTICNELELNRRRSIVEFGPGLSTLIMAAWAEHTKTAINIIAVEEDAEWAGYLRERLQPFSYAHTEIIHRPLASYTEDSPLRVSRWYALRDNNLDLEEAIDLVLVDGPTAYRSEWAHDRYPAIHLVKDRMSERCAVLLDDTHRSGEAAIARTWRAELGGTWAVHEDTQCTWFVRGQAWNTRQ